MVRITSMNQRGSIADKIVSTKIQREFNNHEGPISLGQSIRLKDRFGKSILATFEYPLHDK
jgi:hypothetical protein